MLVLEVTPKELSWYKLPGCKTMAYDGVVNKLPLHAYDMVVVKTGEHYDWVEGTFVKESTAAAILETSCKLGFLDGASVDSYKELVVAEHDGLLTKTTTGDLCSGLWSSVRHIR